MVAGSFTAAPTIRYDWHMGQHLPPITTPAQERDIADAIQRTSIRDTARAILASGIPADLVPIRAASMATGIRPSYLYRLIGQGRLPAYRVGQRYLLSLADLAKPIPPPRKPDPVRLQAQREARAKEKEARRRANRLAWRISRYLVPNQ